MRSILLPLLTTLPLWLAAQFTLEAAFPPVYDATGRALDLAWLGGLNAPQYLESDLDGDGRTDLYVFDRAGDAQLALRRNVAGTWTLAPELTRGFPADLTHWVILRDYDGDGIDDLFAYSARFQGFRVHRGDRDTDGLLRFAPAATFAGLYYPYNDRATPIFVTAIDHPAVDDLDGDGDLDILTFSVGGGYVEYYRNYSVERGFGRDSLVYELESDCWGGFFESGLTPVLELAPQPGDCSGRANAQDERVETRHSGSTILTLDADGNGLPDVMLGDISFEQLVLGYNNGSIETAWISEQDARWNAEGVSADIPFFPGAYLADVDGDGVRDLLASPSQTLNAEDVDVGWYYRNTGSESQPDFVFQDSQQFVRQTIDFGTGGLPAALDYDADGRPDLVVGNTERYSPLGRLDSRLRLYRNVRGSDGQPEFVLTDDDYLGLSRFQNSTSAFAPAFGDLDGDGDADAVVGDRSGNLIYLENLAGAGRPVRFADPVFNYMGINVRQLAKPELADLDRDGRTDLVVGGFDGRIRFYRNVGNVGAPVFVADEAAAGNALQLGGINTNKPGLSSGHPTPRVLTYDDRFLLVTGNRSGTLEAYEFAEYTEPFTALSDTVAGLDVGGYSALAVADFDADGRVEMIVGNQRGGLSYYRTDLVTDRPSGLFPLPGRRLAFSIAPNPAAGQVEVNGLPGDRRQTLRLLDPGGRVLRVVEVPSLTTYRLDVSGLAGGTYLVEVLSPAGRGAEKLVVLPARRR